MYPNDDPRETLPNPFASTGMADELPGYDDWDAERNRRAEGEMDLAEFCQRQAGVELKLSTRRRLADARRLKARDCGKFVRALRAEELRVERRRARVQVRKAV